MSLSAISCIGLLAGSPISQLEHQHRHKSIKLNPILYGTTHILPHHVIKEIHSLITMQNLGFSDEIPALFIVINAYLTHSWHLWYVYALKNWRRLKGNRYLAKLRARRLIVLRILIARRLKDDQTTRPINMTRGLIINNHWAHRRMVNHRDKSLRLRRADANANCPIQILSFFKISSPRLLALQLLGWLVGWLHGWEINFPFQHKYRLYRGQGLGWRFSSARLRMANNTVTPRRRCRFVQRRPKLGKDRGGSSKLLR